VKSPTVKRCLRFLLTVAILFEMCFHVGPLHIELRTGTVQPTLTSPSVYNVNVAARLHSFRSDLATHSLALPLGR
jgi:hypothetical protein